MYRHTTVVDPPGSNQGEHEMNTTKESKFLNRTVTTRQAVAEAIGFIGVMAAIVFACCLLC